MFERLIRGLTTNRASLTEQATDPELRPLLVDASIDDTRDLIVRWAKSEPRWKVASVDAGKETDETARCVVHLTRQTALFRFTDDVRVSLTQVQESKACTIDASSRSRVGKGDLGQNSRNLKRLTSGIAQLVSDLQVSQTR